MRQAPFGKYTLIRKLASGGMGEVFLARQEGIGGFEKDVAIKRLLPLHSDEESFTKLFMREARLAARLNHPNIVQTFEMGNLDGSFYLAMEFVDGPDLRHLHRRSRELGRLLPIGCVARIASGVALGLAYAHAAKNASGKPLRIVHRDISPTNVLVSRDGCVKIADFGIAGVAGHLAAGTRGKGKLGYMAPEQIRGEPLDARTDIFALGVLLYEGTAQRRLFLRESAELTLRATLEEPIVPPAVLDGTYPRALERIVLRALERDPARRYPDAEQLHLDLEEFLRYSEHACSTLDLAQLVRETFPEEPPAAPGPESPADDVDVVQALDSLVFPWTRSEPAQRRAQRMLPAVGLLLFAILASAVVWMILLR